MKREMLVVACTALFACSSAANTTDSRQADSNCGTGSSQCTCGANTYPCGPYGTAVGDTAANLSFQGYADADEQCKQNTAKQLDTSKLTDLSFQKFYLGDSSQSCKRRLLWVTASTGWCSSCQTEVAKVQASYASGVIDNRVTVLNVVIETETMGTRADRAFLDAWVTKFKMTFPVGLDPEFSLRGYFDLSKLPFNMLLDLSSMKVFYRETGGDVSAMTDQINAFFSQNP